MANTSASQELRHPSPKRAQLSESGQQRLDSVVARVAARLAEHSSGPSEVVLDQWSSSDRERIVRGWLDDQDGAEVVERSEEELAELIRAHLSLGWHRAAGVTLTDLFTPEPDRDGWSDRGRSVLLVITDDRPFLVDTVSMTLSKYGWDIHQIYHPQWLTSRSGERLVALADPGRKERRRPGTGESAKPDQVAESWIAVEITPPLGTDVDLVSDQLHQAIDAAMADASAATDDFRAMRDRLTDIAAEVAEAARLEALHAGERRRSAGEVSTSASGIDARHVAELLTWLAGGNFTLLGAEDFTAQHTDQGWRYLPVPGSGLGVLRSAHADRFAALPDADEGLVAGDLDRLVITKDSERASVHRPSWLDYLGVREFDAEGRLVGERRFVGLFGSNTYTESVWRIPVVREHAAEIMRRSGHLPESHSAAQLRSIIATYPRDELLQAPVDDLFPVMDAVSKLRERRVLRLFVRRGRWGRFVSCLVYFPRDRYNTDVRTKMMAVLKDRLHAESIEYQAMVSESVLARLSFRLKIDPTYAEQPIDVAALEAALARVTREWDDEFIDLVGDLSTAKRGVEFPPAYKTDYPAEEAVADLAALNELAGADDFAFRVRPQGSDPAAVRIKILRLGEPMRLSDVMPHFASLGLRVVDEWPHHVALRGKRAMIYDFGVRLPGVGPEDPDRRSDSEADFERLTDAFAASYRGLVPADDFQGLVSLTALNWREVDILRALTNYLQQLRSTYSPSYVARALLANPQLAVALVRLFQLRLGPDADLKTAAEARTEFVGELDAVASLDHDRILRQLLAVIEATDRTNWFAMAEVGSPTTDSDDRPESALAIKVRPHDLDFAPLPKPLHEIYVHGPGVEGVHLRFGDVARGGLRWSDRSEDFRTEVLGLVKAQMVKNSVIVPVGAKGGFVPRNLPDPAVDRKAWLDAGVAAYRSFIAALLSVTDNIDAAGLVVPPLNVTRRDDDDPYLVVAADKGTATFSDIANALSLDAGFWLGDAFASGGSAGYDHKAMGITARGAWESVKRHFREIGVDCQETDFTCVGIGDMSGDVFGNGMLLSRHTKLVAAFNHLHIFLDPFPDPEASFTERERLFNLPRSQWSDYDASVISAGGGVFARSAKSVPISPQVRQVLGLDAAVTSLSPNELVNAILKAPVDLLWNGGIGTYVRGETETDAEVGDRANDAVRVTGAEVRAVIAGEGGNLGWTQRGRIEYAQRGGPDQHGGRINTDFIDNSAGVDTSDHEVNIKILLAGEVTAGRLNLDERNELLHSMTDDVARLVLAHNIDQNNALSDAVASAPRLAAVHEMWMRRLVDAGYVDREVEELPSSEEMAARVEAGLGLTNPELASLLSWTKIWLADQILASDLPDDPFVADRLIGYFPPQLRERYAAQMPSHRLHREIITTVAVNRYVHSQGITAYHEHSDVTGAAPADVMRAQLAARSIFGAGRLEVQADREGLGALARTLVRAGVQELIDTACRLLLRERGRLDIQVTIDRYRDGVAEVTALLPQSLDAQATEAADRRLAVLAEAGVGGELSRLVSLSALRDEALGIVNVAERTGASVSFVTQVWFGVIERLRIRAVQHLIDTLPGDTKWQLLARAATQDEFSALVEDLVAAAVGSATAGGDSEVAAGDAVEVWLAQTQGYHACIELIDSLGDDADLAPLSVALRSLRSLVAAR